MPYIITTNHLVSDEGGLSGEASVRGVSTRTAVVTPDDARRAIIAIGEDHGTWIGGAALHGPIDRSDGIIGLPDGAVIEVARVDWMDFERMVVPGPVAAAVPITTFDDDDYRDALIRAYNAR